MSLNTFISQLGVSGVARPNLFEVILTTPIGNGSALSRTVSLYCYQASMPALNIMTGTIREDDVPYEIPYGASYEPAQLTFYVDTNYTIKQYFESWYNFIWKGSNNGKVFEYYENFVGQLQIIALNRSSDLHRFVPTYAVELGNVYPKSISGVQYAHSSNDSIVTMTVDFAYNVINYKSTSSVAAPVTDLLSSYGDGLLSSTLSNIVNKIGNALVGDTFSAISNFVSLTPSASALSAADQAAIAAADKSGIIAQTRSQVNPWSGLELSSYKSTKVS
jgi:hypothetical protein